MEEMLSSSHTPDELASLRQRVRHIGLEAAITNGVLPPVRLEDTQQLLERSISPDEQQRLLVQEREYGLAALAAKGVASPPVDELDKSLAANLSTEEQTQLRARAVIGRIQALLTHGVALPVDDTNLKNALRVRHAPPASSRPRRPRHPHISTPPPPHTSPTPHSHDPASPHLRTSPPTHPHAQCPHGARSR